MLKKCTTIILLQVGSPDFLASIYPLIFGHICSYLDILHTHIHVLSFINGPKFDELHTLLIRDAMEM